MNKSDFHYSLPSELIAQHPPETRGQSRLLVLNRSADLPLNYQDSTISELKNWLQAGDLLVVNDTKVIPARLYGHKDTGGKIEVFLERIVDAQTIVAHVRSSKSLKVGQHINIGEDYVFKFVQRQNELYELKLIQGDSLSDLFEHQGHMPLPPYIQRDDNDIDQNRYQTVYAENAGAVAAPTAGLHFSHDMLNELQAMDVAIESVTLHVGSGTFAPMRVENIYQHTMHSERFTLTQKTCDKIAETKTRGGRVIAVGTTVVRVLESVMQQQGSLVACEGETDIFIYPGYQFNTIDGLLTNFHLPESTLIMLVCAFAGQEYIMQAYQHAVHKKYRFFSYGDAMLILNN